MSKDNSGNVPKKDGNSQSAAATGNASNPSPQNDDFSSPESSQWLNEKAEKYLREVASIEDVPDAQDQEEMDDALKKGDDK